ncbi:MULTISPECIES: hypothetical protein [Halorussus]|uniref:hypothetical protein n=1 Tax=Halorussus TaxID=1070314 RepID=UPI00209D82E6|nr:hypothetical protein [Halorussus vallis]USZ74063.1 hypothetical protein NGM07_11410 [Halorussus vallis]
MEFTELVEWAESMPDRTAGSTPDWEGVVGVARHPRTGEWRIMFHQSAFSITGDSLAEVISEAERLLDSS